MVKIITMVAAVLLAMVAGLAGAAGLKWDASTGDPAGYVVSFTDTEGAEYTRDVGNVTEVADIDQAFNLYPGRGYIFTVAAYTAAGTSGPSNAVEYTALEYVPPVDNLPPVIVIIPGPVTIIVE